MSLRIIADQPAGSRTETRLSPASAAVLAMKWIEQGAQGVRIECQGRAYALPEFRRRFMNGHKKGCP
jgi:hypothetical protein